MTVETPIMGPDFFFFRLAGFVRVQFQALITSENSMLPELALVMHYAGDI